uniref:COBRA-like protein n=1 Tax=Oryza barthii TaxID=65489 RepID=A0A0D3HF83_9ORYZ
MAIGVGGCCAVLLAAALLFSSPATTYAYDSLDPNGNITIKWDVMQWTPDGYAAVVTLSNYQQFRHIQPPGWQLGWTWQQKEVIWSMYGAQAIEQGDCSMSKEGSNVPHSCKKHPTVVDLLPGAPIDLQIANCCKAGSLSAFSQDPANSAASFQIIVGHSGNSNETVRVPKNFSLMAPGPGYICSRAMIVKPSRFLSPDGRRATQALMTWNVICTYSQFLAQKVPSCCVSLSSFDNDKTVDCPTCSCGCRNEKSTTGKCVKKNAPDLQSIIHGPGRWTWQPLLQCTSHMCPVKINWHLMLKDKEHYRVKITVTNLNYRMNFTEWNLVVQYHPILDITQISGFNYKSIQVGKINDTTMLWGVKPYYDLLMQAGPLGNVQGELIVRKDFRASSTTNNNKGRAFPVRVYFNGDNCVMPPPDAYPVSITA